MKVGSLIYACDNGLGMLARWFHEQGITQSVFLIEHPHYANHPEWYPHSPRTPLRNTNNAAILRWVREEKITHLLFYETPFVWGLLPKYQEYGIKTVLMPMCEWMLEKPPATFDLYLCPSLWDVDMLRGKGWGQVEYLPVPAPPDSRWRLRERARHFIHNSGHIGSRNHKGSDLLFQAIPHIQSPCQITIRSQTNRITNLMRAYPQAVEDPRVQVIIGDVPYHTLFDAGDALLQVERYNGLSLPLQEAFASGMPVITSHRFPHNTWLPNDLLVPVARYEKVRVASGYMQIDEAIIDPLAIAAKVDSLFDTDITSYSLQGKQWAEEHSWDQLKPRYLALLGSLG